MDIRAFAESYPCARRRLEDGEPVIPTYTYRGRRGWWGRATPLGGTSELWYFYFPYHSRPNMAISAVEKALGHPVWLNSSSDEEVYFWANDPEALLLMSKGPRWCRIRRKTNQTLTPARGEEASK